MIGPDYIERIIEFGRTNFSQDEPLLQSAGVSWSENNENKWRSVLQEGMSVMLLDITQGGKNIVGFCSLVIKTKEHMHSQYPEVIKNTGFKTLMEFFDYADHKCDFFKHYGISEAIKIHVVCIGQNYRQKGLATALLNFVLQFINNFVCIVNGPIHLYVQASSIYTISIFKKLGFDSLCSVNYSDYMIDGKQVLKNMGDHKVFTLFGKRLEYNK